MVQEIFSEKFQDILKTIWNQLDEKYVFAHNDLNTTNILVDETNEISLIDYEFSGFDKISIEFGNLFNEMTVNYEYDQDPYFKYESRLEVTEE